MATVEHKKHQHQRRRQQEGGEEEVIIYRAFHLSRKRRSLAYDDFAYDHTDLYELHAKKYPVLKANYRWHLNNALDRPVVTVGKDDRIVQLTAAEYFSDKAASIGSPEYILVVTKLIKRRFLGPVLQFDIDQYKTENAEDPRITFLESPIPGIAPVTEILTVTRELPLMHEVIAQSHPESEGGKTEYERHNWTISYEPVDCRSKVDCSLHFTEVEHLPETHTFIIGASRYDPEVLAMNKKQAERRKRVKQEQQELNEMRLFLEAMQIMNMTDEVLDLEEEEDPAHIRAAALAELEEEEQQQQLDIVGSYCCSICGKKLKKFTRRRTTSENLLSCWQCRYSTMRIPKKCSLISSL